jgi:hypothetical protein
MKRDESKKEFSLLDEVEKRLQKIEERMSEMEEKTKTSFAKIQEYIVAADAINRNLLTTMVQVVLASTKSEGKVSDFDPIIGNIPQMENNIKKVKAMSLDAPTISVASLVSMILVLSRQWNIPFEVIAPYLIQKLGKESARRNMQKEYIMQFYGSEALNDWEKLFKE